MYWYFRGIWICDLQSNDIFKSETSCYLSYFVGEQVVKSPLSLRFDQACSGQIDNDFLVKVMPIYQKSECV